MLYKENFSQMVKNNLLNSLSSKNTGIIEKTVSELTSLQFTFELVEIELFPMFVGPWIFYIFLVFNQSNKSIVGYNFSLSSPFKEVDFNNFVKILFLGLNELPSSVELVNLSNYKFKYLEDLRIEKKYLSFFPSIEAVVFLQNTLVNSKSFLEKMFDFEIVNLRNLFEKKNVSDDRIRKIFEEYAFIYNSELKIEP